MAFLTRRTSQLRLGQPRQFCSFDIVYHHSPPTHTFGAWWVHLSFVKIVKNAIVDQPEVPYVQPGNIFQTQVDKTLVKTAICNLQTATKSGMRGNSCYWNNEYIECRYPVALLGSAKRLQCQDLSGLVETHAAFFRKPSGKVTFFSCVIPSSCVIIICQLMPL